MANLPYNQRNYDQGYIDIGGKKFEVVGHDPGLEYMLGPKGERLQVPQAIKGRISSHLSGLKPKHSVETNQYKGNLFRPGKENISPNFHRAT